MKSYVQLVHERAPIGPEVLAASGDFMSGLLVDLYRRAQGKKPLYVLPVPVIAETPTALMVLRAEDRFIKNYNFLHMAMPGRFSANGEEWKSKARLTQRFYSAAFKTVPGSEIDSIYKRHLSMHTNDDAVFETLVSAAVEVVSRAYGLPKTLAWPKGLVDQIRSHTVVLQAIGWMPGPANWQMGALAQLASLSEHLFEQWTKDDATMDFLSRMAADDGSSLRSAQQELLQNVFAATETTASSVCWMLDVLSRNESLCHVLTRAEPFEQGCFVNECLRLFPPVPMVTRACTDTGSNHQDAWLPGQALVISMVGLHTQVADWVTPLRFDHRRVAWQQENPPTSFMPFLYGPRICGGRRLAIEELHIALRVVLQKFRLEPVGASIQFQCALTSRPKHPPLLHRKSDESAAAAD